MYRWSVLVLLVACGSEQRVNSVGATGADEIVLDTQATAARAQYDADVAFVTAYVPRCAATGVRPRVIVSGFGHFGTVPANATGMMVSQLVTSAAYPAGSAGNGVDDPATELSVGISALSLPGVGDVDVCGIILPVFWDVAAIILAKEIDAFQPAFVLMNGVAAGRQPVQIELGSVNAAQSDRDGSNQLQPLTLPAVWTTPIIVGLPGAENARPNRLSWQAVRAAVDKTLTKFATQKDSAGDNVTDILSGSEFIAYPRPGNTYLCNNLTFVTGYLMDHPREHVTLLSASPAIAGRINSVSVVLDHDFSKTPHTFVHWPSILADRRRSEDLSVGTEVMRAMLAAQLAAQAQGDLPTLGDNAIAR